jgi:small-conductance mechanosensitive channel
VSVTEFGESSVNVDLLYWHAPDQATTRRVRSAVAIAAKRALDEAGIDIPFPQRVLHLNDVNVKADDRPGPDGVRRVTGS